MALRLAHKSIPTLAKKRDPNWANIKYPEIDYQSISYFQNPKKEIIKFR